MHPGCELMPGRLCKAVIDRLTDQTHIITAREDSYRFRRTTTERSSGGRTKQRY
jgi:hypothetical protein